MSDEASRVNVSILGKDYLIACTVEDCASVMDAARYLDDSMREIREAGKVIGLDRIAVMAGLNIAHDLLKLEVERDQLTNSIGDRIKILRNRVDNTLQEEDIKDIELADESTSSS